MFVPVSVAGSITTPVGPNEAVTAAVTQISSCLLQSGDGDGEGFAKSGSVQLMITVGAMGIGLVETL